MKIAIVGAGISGIVAAYYLAKEHQVSLIEDQRLGGHTNTIVLSDGPDKNTALDTGFIVCNQKNYPNFYNFLAELGVQTRNSEMSFGYYSQPDNFAYTGPAIHEYIRNPDVLLQAKFWKMYFGQRHFNSRALRDLKIGAIPSQLTLIEYARQIGLNQVAIKHYLIPLAASIWSAADEIITQFPAATFIQFFNNHGMLNLSKRPKWQTVLGGSHSYLKAFKEKFLGQIIFDKAISIKRMQDGIQIAHASGQISKYNKVVIATHANEAFQLIDQPSYTEKNTLATWKYSSNRISLHWDNSIMPNRKSLWASWNYFRSLNNDNQALSITYYMNKLQGLQTQRDYFVTLNDSGKVKSEKTIYQTTYTHPAYSIQAIKSQATIQNIQGENNCYFCGAYLGYGFHEDGVTAALKVVNLIRAANE